MTALAILWLAAAAQPAATPDEPRPVDAEQVQTPREGREGRIEQVGSAAATDVKVEQLPDTIELPRDAHAPEADLAALAPTPPRESLYLEVANAWEMIRRRGQQPTPELIAREIGPDLLARFLNQFPGSEAMFGKDSDQLPVAPPPPPDLPEPRP